VLDFNTIAIVNDSLYIVNNRQNRYAQSKSKMDDIDRRLAKEFGFDDEE
jgi:hypothetical protein